MDIDFFGLVVLLISAMVVGILQAMLALGVMYGMHKGMPDKLESTTYGQFDFDSFQKPAFIDMAIRLALLFVVPTVILHILFSLFFGMYTAKYPFGIGFSLFLLEGAAITVGFFVLFKLDRLRLIILSSSSTIIYLLLLWLVLFRKLR